MNDTLDYTGQEFADILQRTTDIVLDQYARAGDQHGFHAFAQKEVEAWFDEPLPQQGIDAHALPDVVKEKVLDTATGNLGPN